MRAVLASIRNRGPESEQGSPTLKSRYEVFVSRDSFKFNAAHFIAYKGFRERLHGHNYRVSVRIEGPVGNDGYVIDFGDIKRAARDVCNRLNERFLVPMRSDVITIEVGDAQVKMVCEDGTRFAFPLADCVLLDIVHSSAEELAAFVCMQLREVLPVLHERCVVALEVGVAEAPNQEARYRIDL